MKRILKKILLGVSAFIVIVAIAFFALVAWPLPTLTPKQTSQPVAMTDVSIIDTETGELLSGHTVIIENGRIAQLGSNDSLTIPESAARIDGSGKFLMPALWDMHAHLGSPLAPQLSMPLFIAGGVTNIRELGGFTYAEKKKEWQQQIVASQFVGPRIQGQARFIIASIESEKKARELVAEIDDPGADFIKVYNQVLPEPYFALLEAANEKGVAVLGHKPRAVNAIDAANGGHKSFEHARLFLFECYPGADRLREQYRARYSGEDSTNSRIETTAMRREMLDTHDPAMFDALAAAMVQNGTWFCPTHITRKMDAFADDADYRKDSRLEYIHFLQKMVWNRDADGMISRDPSPEGRKAFMDFYQKGLELTGKAHRAGVKILAGTDANDTFCFPGLGIHDELQELVKAGLSPLEVLQTATVNAADYFGLSADYGTVAVGKVADLLLLDANPLQEISNSAEINTVFFNGTIYTRADLDNMLAYVESNSSSLSLACKLIWEALAN